MTATLIVTSVDKKRLDYLLDSLPPEQASLHSALRAALARAEVVEPGHVPPDVVTLNSRVHFVLADADENMSRTLALPKDIHAESLYVSVLSPAGSALLGRRVGECVTWSGSGGETVRLGIVALTWQPERSGDLRRWKGYPADCVNAESPRTHAAHEAGRAHHGAEPGSVAGAVDPCHSVHAAAPGLRRRGHHAHHRHPEPVDRLRGKPRPSGRGGVKSADGAAVRFGASSAASAAVRCTAG
ncbi:hypothetical protein F1735_28695 [Massilia sp. CCM 8694]|uniref:Transcription elongation factor GreA/GreB C-terminal domain-containing protein n=1 Tax=Massilia genomosp. 1 TaxID=2609280 RepID=A0ABX0MTY8_9BURK|nr:hypothetical protein [Massilia genomosp. 1]